MSRHHLPILIPVLIIIAVALFVVEVNQTKTVSPLNTNTTLNNTTARGLNVSDTVAPTNIIVNIEGSIFTPSSMIVKSGSTIIWSNHNNANYTIISNNGAFKGDNIGPGESYSYTFTKSGNYTYTCTVNTSIKGIIIVQ